MAHTYIQKCCYWKKHVAHCKEIRCHVQLLIFIMCPWEDWKWTTYVMYVLMYKTFAAFTYVTLHWLSTYSKVPIIRPVQSNLVIRNVLIRNKLVLRNHFPWPIVNLLHKDKEHLALRNNFRVTKNSLSPSLIVVLFFCASDYTT